MITQIEVTVWVPEMTPDDYCCMWDECPDIIGHGEDPDMAADDLALKLGALTWH